MEWVKRWGSFSLFAVGLALLLLAIGLGDSSRRARPSVLGESFQIASASGGSSEVRRLSEVRRSMEVRRFRFDYEVDVPARKAGEGAEVGEMHLFLPVAVDGPAQRILNLEIESAVSGRVETESKDGNSFWHAKLPADFVDAFSVRVTYDVERRVLRAGADAGDAREAARFLAADDRVVVGHSVLDPILEEIREATPRAGQSERARAIYDWVVDNVEYKKTGTGWGNGDTFWACNERYGNCTDFHSLFISLARTEGIPARFEMGFPVPTDRSSGEIAGYHCWVEFWLPEEGWVPIDASEAFKHPEKRELFYGTHPPDRLHFSTGRDLRLGNQHRDRALNYFIYPYAEIGGKRSRLKMQTRFRYEERAAVQEAKLTALNR
ncbi:MAG: transglutaminase-like domain-containing protein [Myxococcota bacterium]